MKTAAVFLEIVGSGPHSRTLWLAAIRGRPSAYTTYCTHAISWVWNRKTAHTEDLGTAKDLQRNIRGGFLKVTFFLCHHAIVERQRSKIKIPGELVVIAVSSRTDVSADCLKRCVQTVLSVVLAYGGAIFSKMIRIRLHRLHFSDVTKDVVVAASVYFHSDAVCYSLEPRLPPIFKPTANRKRFSFLQTKVRRRQLKRKYRKWSQDPCILKTCISNQGMGLLDFGPRLWQRAPLHTQKLHFLPWHAALNCVTSPFTLKSEVKHSTPHPPHRDAFVLGMHSMSGMGTYDRKKKPKNCMRGLHGWGTHGSESIS